MARLATLLTVFNVAAPVLFLGTVVAMKLSEPLARWLGEGVFAHVSFSIGLFWMSWGFAPAIAAAIIARWLGRMNVYHVNLVALPVWFLGTVWVMNTVQ